MSLRRPDTTTPGPSFVDGRTILPVSPGVGRKGAPWRSSHQVRPTRERGLRYRVAYPLSPVLGTIPRPPPSLRTPVPVNGCSLGDPGVSLCDEGLITIKNETLKVSSCTSNWTCYFRSNHSLRNSHKSLLPQFTHLPNSLGDTPTPRTPSGLPTTYTTRLGRGRGTEDGTVVTGV